jgi:hypothetical protein
VTRHCPVLDLGRALADHDFVADEALAATAGSGLGHAQRAAGAQARDELALERAAALDVKRLVDRLVRDAHRFIIGEIDLQPV